MQSSKNALFEHSKNQWTPPGYLRPWQVINLIGTALFPNQWNENDLGIKRPDILIPENLQLKSKNDIVRFGMDKKYIKQNMKTVVSTGSRRPWQNSYDWFVTLRSGKHWPANTKEEAVQIWLKEFPYISDASSSYWEAISRLKAVKKRIRDALYLGKIIAVSVSENNITAISAEHWADDNAMKAFSFDDPDQKVLFLETSAHEYILKAFEKPAPVKPKPGRKKGDGAYDDEKLIAQLDQTEGKSLAEKCLRIFEEKGIAVAASAKALEVRLARKIRIQKSKKSN